MSIIVKIAFNDLFMVSLQWEILIRDFCQQVQNSDGRILALKAAVTDPKFQFNFYLLSGKLLLK